MNGWTTGPTWCASTASPFLTIFVSPGFLPIARINNQRKSPEDLEPLAWSVESLESGKVRRFHITNLLRRQRLVGDLVIVELQVRLR